VLVNELRGYNIVYFKGKFVGLPKSAGPIDVSKCDLSALPYVFDSQDELQQEVLKRRTEDTPLLVGTVEGFNIVQFDGKIFALSVSLGEVHVTDGIDALLERHGSEKVMVADTIEKALALGLNLAKARGPGKRAQAKVMLRRPIECLAKLLRRMPVSFSR